MSWVSLGIHLLPLKNFFQTFLPEIPLHAIFLPFPPILQVSISRMFPKIMSLCQYPAHFWVSWAMQWEPKFSHQRKALRSLDILPPSRIVFWGLRSKSTKVVLPRQRKLNYDHTSKGGERAEADISFLLTWSTNSFVPREQGACHYVLSRMHALQCNIHLKMDRQEEMIENIPTLLGKTHLRPLVNQQLRCELVLCSSKAEELPYTSSSFCTLRSPQEQWCFKKLRGNGNNPTLPPLKNQVSDKSNCTADVLFGDKWRGRFFLNLFSRNLNSFQWLWICVFICKS